MNENNKNKQCYFCSNGIKKIDYKNTETLKKFLDPFARISPKKKTGVCSMHQRKMAKSVKQARIMALLPFVGE